MPSHFRITTRWCSVKHSIWNETFLVGRPPLLCAWVWLSGYSDDYKIEWNVFIVLELVFSLQHSKTVEEQEEIEINSIKLLFCCFESIFFIFRSKKLTPIFMFTSIIIVFILPIHFSPTLERRCECVGCWVLQHSLSSLSIVKRVLSAVYSSVSWLPCSGMGSPVYTIVELLTKSWNIKWTNWTE